MSDKIERTARAMLKSTNPSSDFDSVMAHDPDGASELMSAARVECAAEAIYGTFFICDEGDWPNKIDSLFSADDFREAARAAMKFAKG